MKCKVDKESFIWTIESTLTYWFRKAADILKNQRKDIDWQSKHERHSILRITRGRYFLFLAFGQEFKMWCTSYQSRCRCNPGRKVWWLFYSIRTSWIPLFSAQSCWVTMQWSTVVYLRNIQWLLQWLHSTILRPSNMNGVELFGYSLLAGLSSNHETSQFRHKNRKRNSNRCQGICLHPESFRSFMWDSDRAMVWDLGRGHC